jgi:glucose-1-phosphate cytidylyltransferase
MKVVLLAGGLGTRLAEETTVKPKPMVEIGDQPILWHLMKSYAADGFNEFAICLGYKGEVIKRFFFDFYRTSRDATVNLSQGTIDYHGENPEDWRIDLIDTGRDTMTGGRLHRLQSLLESEGTFMLTYGDGLCNVDINQLLDFHRQHGKLCTMTAVRPPARFGTMIFDGDRVAHFEEKPQTGEGWINGGFFVMEPGVFDYLDGDATVLELEPLERLAQDGQLMAYRHEGFWQCMDTIRDKKRLESIWAGGNAPWKKW